MTPIANSGNNQVDPGDCEIRKTGKQVRDTDRLLRGIVLGAGLDAVAAACRDKGARVAAETIDVVERDAMAGWVTAADDTAPLALVVANAAISAQTRGGGDDDVRSAHVKLYPSRTSTRVDGQLRNALQATW